MTDDHENFDEGQPEQPTGHHLDNGMLGEFAVEGQVNDPSQGGQPEQDLPISERVAGSERAASLHNAMQSLLSQAEKVEASGESGSESLAKKLREDGVELGAKALEQLEKEKQALEDGEEYVVGRLMAIASGEIETETGAFILASSESCADLSDNGMTREQVESLRDKVYTLLGITPPSVEEFYVKEGGDFIDKLISGPYYTYGINTLSAQTGLELFEQRSFIKKGKLGDKRMVQRYMGLYARKVNVEQDVADESPEIANHN